MLSKIKFKPISTKRTIVYTCIIPVSTILRLLNIGVAPTMWYIFVFHFTCFVFGEFFFLFSIYSTCLKSTFIITIFHISSNCIVFILLLVICSFYLLDVCFFCHDWYYTMDIRASHYHISVIICIYNI